MRVSGPVYGPPAMYSSSLAFASPASIALSYSPITSRPDPRLQRLAAPAVLVYLDDPAVVMAQREDLEDLAAKRHALDLLELGAAHPQHHLLPGGDQFERLDPVFLA